MNPQNQSNAWRSQGSINDIEKRETVVAAKAVLAKEALEKVEADHTALTSVLRGSEGKIMLARKTLLDVRRKLAETDSKVCLLR